MRPLDALLDKGTTGDLGLTVAQHKIDSVQVTEEGVAASMQMEAFDFIILI